MQEISAVFFFAFAYKDPVLYGKIVSHKNTCSCEIILKWFYIKVRCKNIACILMKVNYEFIVQIIIKKPLILNVVYKFK